MIASFPFGSKFVGLYVIVGFSHRSMFNRYHYTKNNCVGGANLQVPTNGIFSYLRFCRETITIIGLYITQATGRGKYCLQYMFQKSGVFFILSP